MDNCKYVRSISCTTMTQYKLWNYSHPAFKERVEFANSYSPWEKNRPLKYEKYIVE